MLNFSNLPKSINKKGTGMIRKLLFLVLVVGGSIMFTTHCAYAQEEEDLYTPFYFPYTAESESWFQPFYHPFDAEDVGWFMPFIGVREEYDDNIFLSREDEESDFITTVQPGFVIQSNPASKHRLVIDYLAELNFFMDNDSEDNNNHTVNAGVQFDFDEIHLNIINMYKDFSDRSGTEDVSRIERAQDHFWADVVFLFNKLDLLLGYNRRDEDYDSEAAIGNYKNQTLTYEDLERDEHEGTVEAAFKLWPKTALLGAFDFGEIKHDTEIKSDSDFYDLLAGIRGAPTAKSMAEVKVGFRNQDYDNYDDDFKSLIFDGSWIEKFNDKNLLRFDFERKTNDTIFQDNAYYESSYIGADFEHSFTDRLSGNVGASYQLNAYPTQTTLDGLTDHREDDFWSGGIGLAYKLPKRFVVDVKYQYRLRDSNFSRYDYKNTRISVGLKGRF